MANEATIIVSLGIRVPDANNNILLDYQSRPTSFRVDVSEARGPTPGTILATTDGVDVDLSLLTTPGLCRVTNLDDTNYVVFGRWDNDNTLFYPMIEVGPSESYIFKLAQDIGSEYSGTGTVEGGNTSTLRVKADTASCYVLVEAFER